MDKASKTSGAIHGSHASTGMPLRRRKHNLRLFPMYTFPRSPRHGMKLTNRSWQGKANFDVSHEIDEFLMVEKPLTHSKRKANPNLEKMKPELRQLEEQYVHHSLLTHVSHSGCRFTVYNFTNMKRMSYYPHNQPLELCTESNDTEQTCTQSVTGTFTIIPTATIVERSQTGTPVMESSDYRHLPPIPQPSSKDFAASWTLTRQQPFISLSHSPT